MESWSVVDGGGVAVEVVQELLGRSARSTRVDAYSHLDVEHARRALIAAGALEDTAP